jgi:peptidoglycan/LPS O-acetylase OafA/YrhL
VLALAGYGALLFNGHLGVTNDWGLVRCLCGFFFGMLICALGVNGRANSLFAKLTTFVIGILEIGLFVVATLIMSFLSDPSLFWIIPVFICMVAVLQLGRGPIAAILMSPPALFLGRISYSIYMVHFFLIIVLTIVLQRLFKVSGAIDPTINDFALVVNPLIGDLLALGTVVTVLMISTITYAMIEEPSRLFGRRLAASFRSPRPAAEALPTFVSRK